MAVFLAIGCGWCAGCSGRTPASDPVPVAITGRVSDARTGEAVRNAHAELGSHVGDPTTDDGVYTVVVGYAATPGTLRVSAVGYATRQFEFPGEFSLYPGSQRLYVLDVTLTSVAR